MGFAPEVVDRMSYHELAWCLDGYATAHGAKGDGGTPPMSADRARELGIVGF